MVLTGHAFTDGALHQTRQGWKYVDGRVNLAIVELTIDIDLSLGNVTGQIGYRMRNI